MTANPFKWVLTWTGLSNLLQKVLQLAQRLQSKHPHFKLLTFFKGNDGDFDWSAEQQGIILGSYYYGYFLTLILGGYLAEKYSGKWVFGSGVFFSGVFSVISPWLALEGGFWAFLACRICIGAASVRFILYLTNIVPSCQEMEQECWRSIKEFVHDGTQGVYYRWHRISEKLAKLFLLWRTTDSMIS